MNLILLFPEDFNSPETVHLADDRAEHLRKVLRASVGQKFKVGRVQGGIGSGEVTRIDRTGVDLKVSIPEAKPEIPVLSLIVALPRPQTLKKILEIIGACGVRELFLLQTARVQGSFFGSKLLKDKGWMKHLRLGLEQGMKTFLSEVSVHPSLHQFLKKEFPSNSIRLIADLESSKTLWDSPLASPHGRRPIFCAIGPEGGWLEKEVHLFEAHGFQAIHLGATIHRVENAVTSLLAQIELLQLKFSKETTE